MAQNFQIPHLPTLRQKYGDELANALVALGQGVSGVADQTATNASGTASGAPPQISGISVTEKDGIHDVQITDSTPAQRGVNYFAEYSHTADFANFHKIDLGSSQNHRANLGGGTYHWRAYSAYGSSEHSEPVMHGGATAQPVGSGSYVGPDMQAQQGGMGFGPQYRGSNGPPTRSA